MISNIPLTPVGLMEALARRVAVSEWHDTVPEGLPFPYYYHASSLTHCPRQLTLKRAGLATDGHPLKSSMNLVLGQHAHTALLGDGLDQWLYEHSEAELLFREQGFYHPNMPLAAKPDAVIRIDGRVILLDLKTEQEGCSICHKGSGMQWREQEAKERGADTAARYEHQVQLVATAMCVEACTGVHVDEGRVYYVTKSQWWASEELVDVNEPNMRADVRFKIENLEAAYAAYEADGTAPARLEKDAKGRAPWECRPVTGSPKGQYCECRSICFARKD